MPRFSANISTLFTERDFCDRFAAAAEAGFSAVELQFPYAFAADELAARKEQAGVELVLLNTPPGNADRGERGLAALPGREREFADAFARALSYAEALSCPRIHVMAGLVPEGADPTSCRDTFIANLRMAAEKAAAQGVTILIEPINPTDMPGYFLSRQKDAHAIARETGADNIAVQMDLYHCGMSEGDVASQILHYWGGVGHFQFAGVPGRHEPDTGAMDYGALFAMIDNLGYDGWCGAEYFPANGTLEGLGWMKALG